MSLKLKINFLILVIASVLAGSFSVFSWNASQIENINTKYKFGQILFSTSDKLELGKLILQSDSTAKSMISSTLIDDVFTMQIAIKSNLQNETQPEQITNLRNIQIQLPAINLLLRELQTRLNNNEELSRDDILSLEELDEIANDVQITVREYDRYLNAEKTRITKTTTLYTRIIIGMMIILVLTIILLSTFNILRPIKKLADFAKFITQGTYDQSVDIRSRDELGQLGDTFNSMSAQLNDLISNLEKRISERTFALERRSAYLEGSADISRAVGSILEPSELITQVVNLIKERFNLYYVGLFLVDNKNEWAILQSGTGQAGEKMLADAHRIKIGEGMIGWSIANTQSRIALDVGEDAVRFDNPNLPNTRSEGALPLRSRGRVLGALTIQSTMQSAFDEETITTLQTMTDQIAIALDNAELFAKSEAALVAERKAYGEMSREAWINLSKSQTIPRYISDTSGASRSIPEKQSTKTLAAIQNKKIVQRDKLTAIIPIKGLDGQILGGVRLRKPKDGGVWTQDQLKTIETLAEQLSISLESARLFDQSQRRTARERVIGEASAKMRETLNIESVLETATKELHKALGGVETKIWLNKEQRKSKEEQNND